MARCGASSRMPSFRASPLSWSLPARVATGRPAFAGEERGVLRRVVPQWLRMAELRPLVVGFEEAHQGHGGGGALYVRLRRARRGPAA